MINNTLNQTERSARFDAPTAMPAKANQFVQSDLLESDHTLLTSTRDKVIHTLCSKNVAHAFTEGEVHDALPDGLLPDCLQNFVDHVTAKYGYDSRMTMASVLGVASVALGGGLVMESPLGGKLVRGNIYVLGLAPSGDGKSLMFGDVEAPLGTIRRRIRKEYDDVCVNGKLRICYLRDALKEKGLDKKKKEEIRKEIAEIDDKIRNPILLDAGNATTAGLIKYLRVQKNTACASISSEARSIIHGLGGKFTSTDLFISAFNQDEFKSTRSGAVEGSGTHHEISSPTLTVTWLVQTDEGDKFLADDRHLSSGLVGRFLVVESNISIDPTVGPNKRLSEIMQLYEGSHRLDTVAADKWEEMFAELTRTYRSSDDTHTITMSREARDTWQAYMDGRMIGEDPVIAIQRLFTPTKPLVSTSRIMEIILKVSMILHAAEHGFKSHKREMTAKTVTQAIDVVGVLIADGVSKEVNRLIGQEFIRIHKTAGKIIKFLQSQKGMASRRLVRQMTQIREAELVEVINHKEYKEIFEEQEIRAEGSKRKTKHLLLQKK